MNAEGLKVLDIKIKNFKNITKREVQLDGKSILLIGPNKIGKSSFIQAINSPLDAKYVPLTPVKTGEEKGEIHLKIGGHLKGEDLEYIVSCYFSAENSKGKVIIKNTLDLINTQHYRSGWIQLEECTRKRQKKN